MIRLYQLSESFLLLLIIVTFAFGQPNTADPRTGHNSEVETASFSPDNKMLASAGKDGLIIVWDLATNKEIFKINPTATEIYKNPVFSPDGRIIAGLSCSESGYSEISGCKKVEFWDAKSGKSIGSLTGEFSEVQEISFSPDKKTIAVADNNVNISIWDISTKEELQTFAGAVTPMAFNPGGTVLAASNGEDGVDLWNLKSGDKIRTIEGVSNALSLAFNPLGDLLASVNEFTKKGSEATTKYVRLWRVAAGTKIAAFADVKTGGLCAFTADGKNLIVSEESEYSEIRFSVIEDKESILLLNPTTGRKQSGITINLDLSGDIGGLSPNRQLLAVLEGRDVHVIDLQEKAESNVLKGHSIKVTSIIFSPDGKNLLSSYEDGKVVRWDPKTGKVMSSVEAGKHNIVNYGEPVLIPNSDYFIRGSNLVFFNLTDGTPFKTNESPAYLQKGFAFSRDGKTVAVLSDETISFFEVPGLRLINRFVHQLPTKDTYNVGMAFASDGKTVAIAIKTDITLGDVSTGKIVKSITAAGGIGDLAFSPDDKFLVAAPSEYSTSSEAGIQVFDLTANKLIYKLLPKPKSISIPIIRKPPFAISPESKMLATIDEDGKVNFFNLADGKLILTSKNAYEANYEKTVLAFNADTSILAVGGRSGIKLFRTAAGEEIRTMK